jgi:hypothetical protein
VYGLLKRLIEWRCKVGDLRFRCRATLILPRQGRGGAPDFPAVTNFNSVLLLLIAQKSFCPEATEVEPIEREWVLSPK